MRVDAHTSFPLLTESASAEAHELTPADILPDLALAGLDGCVVHAKRENSAETQRLLALAGEFACIRGVVGWVDLLAKDVSSAIELHAADPLLRGFVHDARTLHGRLALASETFRNSLRQLRLRRMALDLSTNREALPALRDLARSLPNQVLLISHQREPAAGRVRDASLEEWRSELSGLRDCENISIHLPAFEARVVPDSWSAEEGSHALEIAVEVLGIERVLFGSAWPAGRRATSYSSLVAVLTAFAERLSPAEGRAILGGNAVRAYHLAPL